MDVCGHGEVGRLRFDNSREDHTAWNVLNQHNQNALYMNKRVLNIIAERDAAIEERNMALVDKKRALKEREEAISQRDVAIKERNDAILERENALNAFEHSMNHQPATYGMKRLAYNNPYGSTEMQILDTLCKTAVEAACNRTPHIIKRSCSVQPAKRKRITEDVNRQSTGQLKLKNDWESQILGLNRVEYDESSMPVPGCSCTGVMRHCYKWGNGGWQSSCCTTTMSAYPLPPLPNKRYARMGGRKMSASAFSKLLSRLAAQGYDFSIPVDLKDRWSRHGTNRYITIK